MSGHTAEQLICQGQLRLRLGGGVTGFAVPGLGLFLPHLEEEEDGAGSVLDVVAGRSRCVCGGAEDEVHVLVDLRQLRVDVPPYTHHVGCRRPEAPLKKNIKK